jgi:hypothetical protein
VPFKNKVAVIVFIPMVAPLALIIWLISTISYKRKMGQLQGDYELKIRRLLSRD